jgi:hypothetical protein
VEQCGLAESDHEYYVYESYTSQGSSKASPVNNVGALFQLQVPEGYNSTFNNCKMNMEQLANQIISQVYLANRH